MTIMGVRAMIWGIVGLIIGLGGGYYLRGRYGALVKSTVDQVL